VDDLVEGIYRLLMSDYHLPINIGNPSEITIKEFGEEILKLTGANQKLISLPLPKDDIATFLLYSMPSSESAHPVKENTSLASYNKWKYTLYTTIIVLLIFNPFTFKFMNSLLSNILGKIASNDGCPTLLGLVIHAVVFTLIIRFMMDLHI
jgi:hypothetical protein